MSIREILASKARRYDQLARLAAEQNNPDFKAHCEAQAKQLREDSKAFSQNA